MINIPPIKLSTEIKTELIPDVTKTWKIGQLLNATVENGGEALSRVLLRVGQQQLEARTPVPLKAGDQVQLLIKSLGDPPLLSIQTTQSQAQLAADKLRGFIAQQTDLGKLFQNLQQTLASTSLPTAIKQPLQQLLQNLPQPQQLIRPELLKAVIANTGIALESSLAASSTAKPIIDTDIKASLLRLAYAIQQQDVPPPVVRNGKPAELNHVVQQFIRGEVGIRQLASNLFNTLSSAELIAVQKFLASEDVLLPPVLMDKLPLLVQHVQQHPSGKQLAENLLSLLRNLPPVQDIKALLETAVARISSQQLMPLTREADSPLLLFFDIPVKEKQGFNTFQFRVEQDAHQAGDEQGSWTVTINFDLHPMGPVQAKLHLIDTQISTVFYAQNNTTVSTLQRHIGLLEQAYLTAGLQPGRIDVIAGKPPRQRALPESVHMVDEEA